MTYHEWRLAPVEGVGNLLPDELYDVVDRRLEERGGEGDGDTEERCEDECPQIPDGTLVHDRTLLLSVPA